MPRCVVAWSLGLAALFLTIQPVPARAACPMPLIIGQWQHLEDNSRWAFFSSGKVDCRLCSEWNARGACVYVYDAADEQKRRQCRWASGQALGRQAPDGGVTVTGWRARDGLLDVLEFSDGTKVDVSACKADGEKGELTLPAVGTFACHYNYQCSKLEREAR